MRSAVPRALLLSAALAVLSAVVALGLLPARNATADARLDFPLPNGHFYAQAAGGLGGFALVDDRDARLWSAVRALGGVDAVGYPISRRFVWDGFVSQVFQKGALQWRPERGDVVFVNALDRLSAAGLDPWLRRQWLTPPPDDASADSGLAWPDVVARHLALLEANPAIRERFLATPRWLDLYGLPTSVADYGDVYVVRAQRAIVQQWRVATPWARPGDVLIANTGEVLRESGLLDGALFVPEPWPTAAREPAQLRIPAVGIQAPVRAYELNADGSLPAPDGPQLVAWYRYSALPGSQGNSVIAGHLDWRGGLLGVFWRLKELRPGDTVLLDTADGSTARYRVTSSRAFYEANAPVAEILGPSPTPVLTIITCEGEFDRISRNYNQRRIVRAVLEQPLALSSP